MKLEDAILEAAREMGYSKEQFTGNRHAVALYTAAKEMDTHIPAGKEVEMKHEIQRFLLFLAKKPDAQTAIVHGAIKRLCGS